VVGDKTPGYIASIRILNRAFPKAKFIYSVRDPRALANSFRKGKARKISGVDFEQHISQVLKQDMIIQAYLEKSNFTTIRYEDLVCKPKEACAHLYEFLGCDFSNDYLRYDPSSDVYPDRWYWIPRSQDAYDATRVTAWREEMARDDIERINELAHPYLERWGYSLF
jgi:hypothetical protein